MELAVRTADREDVIDLTERVVGLVANASASAVLLSVLHTSCALVIQENDGKLPKDMHAHLDSLVPWQGNYTHNLHDDNAAAHIKAAMLGNSVMIPVRDKKLLLGTWQRILLFEFDGPRDRTVHVQLLRNP